MPKVRTNPKMSDFAARGAQDGDRITTCSLGAQEMIECKMDWS